MNQNSRNPISWVPTVYFAMGLPFVVLNMVSVLMFKGLGIGDAQIALWTSLIMLPWTLKFLWSPFLEMFKTKKFFVVLTQLITGAGFALVALALHLPAFFAVCIALLAVIAFSGATHDVATDGVYMSELNKQDQAKYIGWQGAFYNIAKIVASGGLVWLAGWLLKYFGGVQGVEEAVRHEATVQAWMTVMLILAAVMVFLGVYHVRMLPSGGTAATGAASGRETWNRLVEVIRAFFQKKHIWYYVAFIILYRLAEGFVMKIVPLFLKAERSVGGLGLGEQEIGLYYGTYGAAAFVLGSLLAGYYISHRGLSRTLFSLCCIFNLPFLAFYFNDPGRFLQFIQCDKVYFIFSFSIPKTTDTGATLFFHEARGKIPLQYLTAEYLIIAFNDFTQHRKGTNFHHIIIFEDETEPKR
jgi:PAT family beta-lactamase induction signal transducer AmpG